MATRKLDGQVAWIGGGASGIGAAVAELFADEGGRVAVADVQTERGEALVRHLGRAGGQAVFTPCNVAREVEVQASIEQAVEQFGGLQIVVNCAGVVHVGPLDDYREEQWDELMAVNVKSIFFAVKHAIDELRKNRRSYVVNIGSVSSFVGQALTPAYTASKGAVLQLSRSIALDYAADGLRSNCICPGITDTPMLRFHLSTTPDPEAALRERLARVPLGVAMDPRDIAKAALYLACEDSSGITGTSLIVDGGYLCAGEWSTTHTRFMEP
ncbi:MAG TPA: glucose 1-dehydrogenase [Pirellulales bacterium]|jgi:NAD(P)-dependent dehydrogenase (short-subunit alcohol dehydrogenase family)|nr:glucose 1-dehydrogenase [Pirellulales bacterium]